MAKVKTSNSANLGFEEKLWQVEAFDRQIATNEDQSRTLAALRDALRPKLMSGELRVPVR
jgi:hypothetical protein